MRSKNCATKWSNSVNSLGMLPTEEDDRDKVYLVSGPYGKSLIQSYTTEMFCPDFSFFFFFFLSRFTEPFTKKNTHYFIRIHHFSISFYSIAIKAICSCEMEMLPFSAFKKTRFQTKASTAVYFHCFGPTLLQVSVPTS